MIRSQLGGFARVRLEAATFQGPPNLIELPTGLHLASDACRLPVMSTRRAAWCRPAVSHPGAPSQPAPPRRAKAHFQSGNCPWQNIGVQLVSAPSPDRPAPPLGRPAVPRWPLGSVDVSVPAQSTPTFSISPLPTRQTGRAICLLVPEIPSPGGPGPLIHCNSRHKHLCLPRHTSTRKYGNPLAFRHGLPRVLEESITLEVFACWTPASELGPVTGRVCPTS